MCMLGSEWGKGVEKREEEALMDWKFQLTVPWDVTDTGFKVSKNKSQGCLFWYSKIDNKSVESEGYLEEREG